MTLQYDSVLPTVSELNPRPPFYYNSTGLLTTNLSVKTAYLSIYSTVCLNGCSGE